MFGSSKRKDAEALAAIREEMAAAELRSRAVLADALAKMELRLSRDLEQRRRLQTVTESAVETFQSSLVHSSTEVARALGQVANMCAIVAERLDADRLERRAFTEAIARASRPPVAKADGPSQIIGGTFFATSEVPDDEEISAADTNGSAGASADDPEHIDAVHIDAPHIDAPHIDAPHIDTTSYPTALPGTTIELSTNGERSANGEQPSGVSHQEAGDPRV